MWLLAFDAGGSRTRAVLHHADADGEHSFVGQAGPANLKTLGNAGSFAALVSAYAEAAEQIAASPLAGQAGPARVELAALVCCLAGSSAGTQELRRLLLDRFAVEDEDLCILPDYEAPLGLPAPELPRVALIAGTGSIAVAVDARRQRFRAGGLGAVPGQGPTGDPGSAYWLAQRIAAQAGLTLPKAASPAEVAGYLPQWLADPPINAAALQALIAAAGAQLAESVERVHRAARLEPEFPLFLSGGLLLNSQRLRTCLTERLVASGRLRPTLALVPEPWRGALGLAWLVAMGLWSEPVVTSV
jgi:hypothetical protein